MLLTTQDYTLNDASMATALPQWPGGALRGPWTILVVDDHPVVRVGQVGFISQDPRFRVIGEAPNADVAQQMVINLRPQMVMMDISMPGTQAREVVQLWRLTWSSLRVVMCSSHADLDHVRGLTGAGAWGYILKEEYPETYLEGLSTVAGGRRWLSPSLRLRLTKTMPERLVNMSARELEVLAELGQGKSLPDIATRLAIGTQDVNDLVSSLMGRLKVRSVQEVATEGLIFAPGPAAPGAGAETWPRSSDAESAPQYPRPLPRVS